MDIKSILDWMVDIITVAAVPSAVVAYLVSRKESKDKAQNAIAQIDKMAAIDLPYLNEQAKETNQHLQAQTQILNKQTEILQSVDRNIAVLIDRVPRFASAAPAPQMRMNEPPPES